MGLQSPLRLRGQLQPAAQRPPAAAHAWCRRAAAGASASPECAPHLPPATRVRVAALQVQVGGSPLYITDKKLGKGGFGQVYMGRRAQPTKDKDGANANMVRRRPPPASVAARLQAPGDAAPLPRRAPMLQWTA